MFQVLRDSYLLAADLVKPRLYLWPLNSQTPVPDVRLATPGKVSAVACSPNTKYAIAAINEKLFVWQLCSGRLISTLTGHFQTVTTIKFNGDGSCFASSAEDNLIFIWSLGGCANSSHLSEDSCKPLCTISTHSRPVKDICFGSFSNRSILCSVSLDKSLKIHDTSTGDVLLSIVFNEPLTTVCLDANESYVFIGTMSGSIRQFCLRNPTRNIDQIVTSKDYKPFVSHEVPISSLSVSPDGSMLLSGDDSGKVNIWDIGTRVITKQLSFKGRINIAVFSPAYDSFNAERLNPSLKVKTLQWNSTESNDGKLEIVCEDGSAELLNYDDYVKDVGAVVQTESSDRNLLEEIEELKKKNQALAKMLMKKVLTNSN